jgi:uncharacterized protein
MSNSFEEILTRRFNRRSLLGGAIRTIPAAALMGGATAAQAAAAASGSNDALRDRKLTFKPITAVRQDSIVVSEGYRSSVLLKWGDPLITGTPAFDPMNQTSASQSGQFGYNCDWMGYLPLPAFDTTNPRSALLVVNHEYTNPELMFKNYAGTAAQTREQTDIELAAHGMAVVEITRSRSGDWTYVPGSRFNRRITANTVMTLSGPAAGSDWLKTSADPTGTTVLGCLNNCSGGITPWGTAISGEENFHQYFSNASAVPSGPVRTSHTRYGLPSGAGEYPWARHYDRFDLAKVPNEPFRHGYMVEFDPYDPASRIFKRTALGRFRHEGCTFAVAPNGQVVGYMGDDERFEFVYKFVSKNRINPFDRAANMSLLDEGTLYVAQFSDDGTGRWLPLIAGEGPLTNVSGFTTQADVCVNTRLAATLMGGTRMDRPEDIEPNPVNGNIYITLTNNTRRTDRDLNKSNPRANNRFGHIIELAEPNGDQTSLTFNWEVFILCGDPAVPGHATFFAGYDPRQVSKLANPDNITFDSKGNLWISTDGQPGTLGVNDGIYAVPTEGNERGYVRQIFSGVNGAETSSLVFNSDDTALFVGIQHPGEGGKWTDTPTDAVSNWPDSQQPPRPSVVVVSKVTGNPVVGS